MTDDAFDAFMALAAAALAEESTASTGSARPSGLRTPQQGPKSRPTAPGPVDGGSDTEASDAGGDPRQHGRPKPSCAPTERLDVQVFGLHPHPPEELCAEQEEEQEEEEDEETLVANEEAQDRELEDSDMPHLTWLRAEQAAAQACGMRWQERGPPPPPPGAKELWRGQKFRQGSQRWGNRGGQNVAAWRKFYEEKKKGFRKGGKGTGKGTTTSRGSESGRGGSSSSTWT